MSWKDIVKNVAPTIGAALGGPAGGMAVKFLAEELLGDSSAKESDVADYILNSNPDQMLKLKQLENDFILKMRELDIDVFALEVKDRDSARGLFKVNIWPQIILSAVFVIGYFSLIGGILAYHDIQIDDRMFGILNTIIGVLTGSIPQIFHFWFGSSTGSKSKDSFNAMHMSKNSHGS